MNISGHLRSTALTCGQNRRFLELSRHLQEFRAKNYELQNRQGVNPYDEMIELTREYDELLHNSVVSDFLQAEQQICKLLQRVFDSIAEGLEFDYINE